MPGDMYEVEPWQQPSAEEAREHYPKARAASTPSVNTGRPRTATDTAEIDETLSHPGSVRINVKGAFIVDQESATPISPAGRSGSPARHGTKDIRLPYHTAVVSHIAVDVRTLEFSHFPPIFAIMSLLPAAYSGLPS